MDSFGYVYEGHEPKNWPIDHFLASRGQKHIFGQKGQKWIFPEKSHPSPFGHYKCTPNIKKSEKSNGLLKLESNVPTFPYFCLKTLHGQWNLEPIFPIGQTVQAFSFIKDTNTVSFAQCKCNPNEKAWTVGGSSNDSTFECKVVTH